MTSRRTNRGWVTVVGAAVAVLALAASTVISSPTAHAATELARDGFDRTVASGWGTSELGGASWSVLGGTASTVGGSTATVKGVAPGRSMRAALPTVASDASVWAEVRIPAATQFYYATESRRQPDGSSYRGRVRVDANRVLYNEITRLNGVGETILAQKRLRSVSVGQVVHVEISASGSEAVYLTSRVWIKGTTVPSMQTAYTDTSSARIAKPGTIGVWGYVSGTTIAANNTTTDVVTEAFGATSYSTTAPVAPPVAPPVATASGQVGSLAVGTAAYPLPSGAIYVSSASGNDGAAGTVSAPLKTVAKAIEKAKAGSTIVLRGGSYHESIMIPPSKPLTLQNYPREAAWFDGSTKVGSISTSGAVWKADGWTAKFDSGPTYTKGGTDSTAAGWQFVNPAYPMAAHPDQLWIGGAEQTQVGSLSQVKAGTFYADYAANRLYFGTNPSGKTVEASDIAQAMSLRAPGTVIRGIGVRRYADSVYMQGVITSYFAQQALENVEVRDSATAGVGFYASSSKLTKVSIIGSGQMGFQAEKADGLVIDNVLLKNNNDQNFNPAPAAGAVKITTTRGVRFTNSEVVGTRGNSFWADHSVYDMTITGNNIHDNGRYGIVLEISSTATVADNVISNNAWDGIVVQDTDKVNIWNNTVVGNRRAVYVAQDSRRITQLNVPGHDPRRSQPDLSMPWIARDIVLGNNILGTSRSDAEAVVTAQSQERLVDGNEMISSSNGNVFSQPTTGTPSAAVVWAKKATYGMRYAKLSDYVAATGRDKSSIAVVGSAALTSQLTPVSSLTAQVGAVAQPLPAAVAAKVGVATGTKHLGAWN